MELDHKQPCVLTWEVRMLQGAIEGCKARKWHLINNSERFLWQLCTEWSCSPEGRLEPFSFPILADYGKVRSNDELTQGSGRWNRDAVCEVKSVGYG